jgi:MmyB-like transcription regulator ligand binding domain
MARFIFLDSAAAEFYQDWDRVASDTVALLRAEAGRNPTDRALSDLIGELSTRSEVFRVRWADHNVRQHRSGVKHLHHPVVGDMSLAYESMELVADVGLVLNGYSAEPGTPSQDALNLLASWAATADREERAHTPNEG